METDQTQRLVKWQPVDGLEARIPSFGDIDICSPYSQKLVVTLPFEEGQLRIEFKHARAFMTSWDGDPNPFLTFEESVSRPNDLLMVEGSRWLASCFNLDLESSLTVSKEAWEHFCIISGERSLHIAARNNVQSTWTERR